jgi:hypothetical protein
MIIKMSNPDILSKTGRELLPEATVEYFKEIRSINYFNVLNKTLSEYTFAEWYVCLDEKVLLEQCLPRYSEKLDTDPLMPGLFSKGEILYKITLIDKAFWIDHEEWYECFSAIIHGVLDLGKEELINRGIREKYIEAYLEAYRNF